MTDEHTTAAIKDPRGPHVELWLEEAQVLLDHAKVGSGNTWNQVMIALDRLEVLIRRVREAVAVEGVNEDLADLVGVLLQWAVRQDRNFDTSEVRKLAESVGLEFP